MSKQLILAFLIQPTYSLVGISLICIFLFALSAISMSTILIMYFLTWNINSRFHTHVFGCYDVSLVKWTELRFFVSTCLQSVSSPANFIPTLYLPYHSLQSIRQKFFSLHSECVLNLPNYWLPKNSASQRILRSHFLYWLLSRHAASNLLKATHSNWSLPLFTDSHRIWPLFLIFY